MPRPRESDKQPPPKPIPPTKDIIIDYVNWRGVKKTYIIRPIMMYFGRTEWHTEYQWLIQAVDLTNSEAKVKSFACKDIKSWKVA